MKSCCLSVGPEALQVYLEEIQGIVSEIVWIIRSCCSGGSQLIAETRELATTKPRSVGYSVKEIGAIDLSHMLWIASKPQPGSNPHSSAAMRLLACFHGRQGATNSEICPHKECANCGDISVGPQHSEFYMCCACFELHRIELIS
jgi:hypothetical protein